MPCQRLVSALAARQASSSCLISRISSLTTAKSTSSGRRFLKTASRTSKPSTSGPGAASDSTTIPPPHPVSSGPSSAAEDDRLLRDVFDSSSVWNSFYSRFPQSRSTGLLNNARLTSANSLAEFAESTLLAAQRVAAAIIAIDTGKLTDDDCRRVVRLFDRLSDMLCRVIDLAEFVRTVHPDQAYLANAERAHSIMLGYMIQLNSSVELFGVLRKVLESENVENVLSREEMIVGKLLLDDFNKSGASLDQSIREEVITVQNNIAVLSRDFMMGLSPAHESITVDINDLTGLDPTLVNGLRIASAQASEGRSSFGFGRRQRNGKPSAQALAKVRHVKLPTTGTVARMAALSVYSSKIREQLYVNSRKSSDRQIQILETLLMQRMRLANLMGSKSFAEYQLSDKMARTPEAVHKFLENLAARTKPAAQGEISLLEKLKAADPRNQEDPVFRAWDRDYYLSQYIDKTRQPKMRSYDFLSAYFSVGTVMQGLSRLFTKLYGIRFVPRETDYASGETWHPDVRKLDIMADTGSALDGSGEQRVGIMYCDLFAREGKPRAPAHYTVRCSRQIYDDEKFDGLDDGIKDIPTLTESDGSVFQLPTIGLVCDFASRSDGRASLLSFAEVETLFHEMGHAMHSMLGRTSLHNISGTRCATDFVELPSVLMEHFARNPDVLALFARHHETDEPLPMPLLEAHLKEVAGFKYNDSYTQIEMSLLDLALHTVSPESLHGGRLDSTAISRALEKQYSLFPPVEGTSWQGQFGHLVGYGAVYYSYLLDRAMASLVWRQVFKGGADGGAVSRDAGEKFKNEVLAWGAGRNAWQCIAGVLERPELEAGGEKAMEIVAMGDEDVSGMWR
ncbi:mitochondrial intermediate peptidase [Myxozyma melibiosi]|uniref:Mitochondrial intermediate peptidase n=1 Tax=Myxozyma melibiosi TaxID=54550 RepID=A0ABR1F6B4_9ASCO